jgi:ketosteroid isomerase-like protein
MHKFILVLTVGLCSALGSAASESTDVMAVVKHWSDAFNRGDVKATLATCAEETSILDDVPPHEWHGVGACSKWLADDAAYDKQNDITHTVVTFGAARHIGITADRAYVVAPASFTYLQKGKPVKETAVVTMSLQKSASGWHITGWAWADDA